MRLLSVKAASLILMRSRFVWTAGIVLLAVVGGILAYQEVSLRARPDILLITIDTLRADRLSIYGGDGVDTPNIDRLAAEGVVCERAVAPMPLTLPSHASIFTSRYPRVHGVMNNYTALPPAESTLAEDLRRKGYRTAAFVGSRLLGPIWRMTQGFDTLDFPQKRSQRPASQVVPGAAAWLAGLKPRERYFLWVHLFDPHLPYSPPPPYSDRAVAESGGGLTSANWPDFFEAASRNGGDVPQHILDSAKALYDGEIELTDHWVGGLVDAVKEHRVWEDTLVVFTADHGECFENGVYFEHSDCLYEGAMRVPLIVLYPGRADAGRRIRTPVSLVDVAPTVLAAAGIRQPPEYSGRPIEIDGEGSGDRAVLIQHPYYERWAAGLRNERRRRIRSVAGDPIRIEPPGEKVGVVTSDWKYLRSGDAEELIRLSERPDETENLAAEESEIRDEMERKLRESLARHPLNLLAPEQLDDELQETLRALGYL